MSKFFSITLDCPSATYYAGEVVKGTLNLHSGGGEKCRSLQLEMVGKARVHWHSGSGDDRNDYDGSKVFLQSQRTLWGNFYRTAILDNAGSDAHFGGGLGDGILYIPCLSNEGSNGGSMRLIIRVCDYDWGKRDDNLGEIVVDAKDLVGKDKVTLDLTCNGKPEQGTITLLARFVPTSTITPDTRDASVNMGKSTTRSVTSSETLILNILSANGLRSGDWFGKNDVYVQAWRAPDSLPIIPIHGKKLPEPDKKITLPGEPITFPFAFPTRADSPGSAVLPCGDYAYIAYYIYAKVDKKSWKDPSMKIPVIILPSRPVPLPRLLVPVGAKVEEEPIYRTKICCFTCGMAGTVTIKFMLDRSAYAPGETIKMPRSEIINDSDERITGRVFLKQFIQLQTWSGCKHTGNAKFPLYKVQCEPLSTLQFGDIAFTIPAVPPSFYGAKGMFSHTEPLIYHYILSVEGATRSGSKVECEIPLLISALPPTRKAIEAAHSTSTDTLSMTSHPEIQANAVLDNRPCETVEEKTGFEDGLNLTPAVDVYGNAYNGNIYSYIEDSGGNAQGSVPYQPLVSVFPSAPSSEMYASAETTQSSSPEPPSSNVRHEEAFDSLLSSLSTETDARLAADQWIKQNPFTAKELTPEQFAIVLKKVLFSFDQSSVARELVVGRGSVTVDHVIATMDACPFSKADLARVMAPYVSDPENKESVLSQLYSFEREEVSKMFLPSLLRVSPHTNLHMC